MERRFSAFLPTLAVSALFATAANAFILTGSVADEGGKAVKGAAVSLIGTEYSTTTDGVGSFTLRSNAINPGSQDSNDPADTSNVAIRNIAKPGFVGVNNGVLSYSQSSNAPVQVQIFDAMGMRVLNQNLYGSGSVDLRSFVKSEGTYFARVKMGSAIQGLKFTTNGSYAASLGTSAKVLKKEDSGNDLQVIADGFDTLVVPLANLDTNVELTLKKASGGNGSGDVGGQPPILDIKGVYDYVKGNAPAPSRGCGKNSSLVKTKSVENGDRFEMQVAGLNREFFITLPKNYDNTKPHKLLFAMHCMGSNAEDFVHHTPDQDHPSPYYGQQKLDTEGNYIFVAPRGDTDGGPWRGGDDKDHQFFDKLLTTMEDNYCIDTSRVFVTGFSFGSMITNSLAQVFQHRVRAAVTYAVADWNIYIPQNAGKPIAWMDVHGTQDNLCAYNRLSSSITRILKNNGPGGTDVSSEINDWQKYTGGNTHVCYDFKKVDPNHPVRVCTWGGGHQWTANDNGGWGNTWVPEDVHKFLEQF
ncbi:MAG: esterase [Fibrobacter sp.]|nr:esterase [Fibrobacter sp.]